jgi:hypothetical protein
MHRVAHSPTGNITSFARYMSLPRCVDITLYQITMHTPDPFTNPRDHLFRYTVVSASFASITTSVSSLQQSTRNNFNTAIHHDTKPTNLNPKSRHQPLRKKVSAISSLHETLNHAGSVRLRHEVCD